MTTINLRSRQLTNIGGGLNALTVEVYGVDADGKPTGAAVASTTTDIAGLWKFLAAANLLHGTRYCVKIIDGTEVQWIDGSDQVLVDELAVATRIVLPDGSVLTAGPVSPFPTHASTSSASYTVPAWHYTVKVDASGGAKTVNLPTAVGNTGKQIKVIKVDSSANTVTVDPNGAETIDYPAASTFVLASQGDCVTCESDGTNVLVV